VVGVGRVGRVGVGRVGVGRVGVGRVGVVPKFPKGLLGCCCVSEEDVLYDVSAYVLYELQVQGGVGM
jgi:hypothetical protein